MTVVAGGWPGIDSDVECVVDIWNDLWDAFAVEGGVAPGIAHTPAVELHNDVDTDQSLAACADSTRPRGVSASKAKTIKAAPRDHPAINLVARSSAWTSFRNAAWQADYRPSRKIIRESRLQTAT
jgi:hypothetical protein